MRPSTPIVILALLVIMSSIRPTALAMPPTQQSSCPTYHTNLVVVFVNSTPHVATVGTTVVTTLHIVYPDGSSPVTLSPEVVSFVWSNSSGQEAIKTAPVVPSGTPGFYTYTANVTSDYPTGVVTISILACSCQDGQGNFGPTGTINSNLTLTPDDDSHVDIGPQTTQQQPSGNPFGNYAVTLAIAALLIIALLLFSMRLRRQQKSAK